MPALQPITRLEGASCRLIALPHAGASISAYRSWAALLPGDIELYALQLPGRGSRVAEPAHSEMGALVDELVEALRPTIDAGIPFAFFGHSFGAIIAVEAARLLLERGLTPPITLLLSAHPAPWLALDPEQEALPRLEADEDFLAGLRLWGFSADEALAGGDASALAGGGAAQLLAVAVPPLRADIALRTEYCQAAAAAAAAAGSAPPPLPIPIHIFGGTEDTSVAPAALEAWSAICSVRSAGTPFAPQHGGHPDLVRRAPWLCAAGTLLFAPALLTSAPRQATGHLTDSLGRPLAAAAEGVADGAPFSHTLLPGGHFYADEPSSRAALLAAVAARMRAALRRLPPSACIGPSTCADAPTVPEPHIHEMIER